MKELWIGVVEVLTEPSETSGNTRAFTNVVTWAHDLAGYEQRVASVFSKYGWTLLNTQNVRRVSQGVEFQEAIKEIIARAKDNPEACIYSTFHYYPSKAS